MSGLNASPDWKFRNVLHRHSVLLDRSKQKMDEIDKNKSEKHEINPISNGVCFIHSER